MKSTKTFQFCDLFSAKANKTTTHKKTNTHHAAACLNWPQRYFHTEATHKALVPTFQVPCRTKFDDTDANGRF